MIYQDHTPEPSPETYRRATFIDLLNKGIEILNKKGVSKCPIEMDKIEDIDEALEMACNVMHHQGVERQLVTCLIAYATELGPDRIADIYFRGIDKSPLSPKEAADKTKSLSEKAQACFIGTMGSALFNV